MLEKKPQYSSGILSDGILVQFYGILWPSIDWSLKDFVYPPVSSNLAGLDIPELIGGVDLNQKICKLYRKSTAMFDYQREIG